MTDILKQLEKIASTREAYPEIYGPAIPVACRAAMAEIVKLRTALGEVHALAGTNAAIARIAREALEHD